jgi:hypothetical protein
MAIQTRRYENMRADAIGMIRLHSFTNIVLFHNVPNIIAAIIRIRCRDTERMSVDFPPVQLQRYT